MRRSIRQAVRDEQGIASILTVIFFILIISVITLGFMRVSILEGEQTLEDSLSKSALAAAYSGVNDAKRALLYCNENNAAPGCDETGLNNPNCRGFFENASLRNALNIAEPDPQTGGISVGDPAANERYTCVLISNDTYDVSGSLKLDQEQGTDIIPLRGVRAFTKVRISWQESGPGVNLAGLNYGGRPASANYRDTDAVGNAFDWQSSWPALMRMSFYSHPTGNINFSPPSGQEIINETTAFLYPQNTGTSTEIGLGALTQRHNVRCLSGAAGYTINHNSGPNRYSCQMTINGIPDQGVSDMYLQLTNQYVDTDYVVELLDAGNNVVKFNNVSPMIDSTGAVENVFRRVQVRLRFQGENPILPNALDVGTGICKNFSVSLDANQFSESCL